MDGGTLRLPPRGTDSSLGAECPSGRGGPGGNHRGVLSTWRLLVATGDKYWVLNYVTAVHGKRGRAGYAGMAICPLPTIWLRASIPPQLM